MSVIIGGVKYLIGPASTLDVVPLSWEDWCRVGFNNQSCVVFRHTVTGELRISWQQLNSQFRTWAPLATREELLKAWY